MTDWADAYLEELRARIQMMDRYGDVRGGTLLRLVVDEITARRDLFLDEELDAAAAARESGYTATALRRLRREGLWSGKRRDLPKRSTRAESDLSLSRSRLDGKEAPSIADRILENRARTGVSPRSRRGGSL